MKRIVCCSAILMLCLAEVTAAVVKGHWEKVDALDSGTRVTVSTLSGEDFSGVFRSADVLSLTIDVDDIERMLPKSEIRKVALAAKQSDPSWDGLLWGASIGGGIGAVVGAVGAGSNDGFALLSRGEGAAVLGILGAGVGGLLGFIADKSQRQSEVLYEARRP